MKKILLILLVNFSVFMMAQTKTVVSINGEKVTYTPSSGEWSTGGNSGTSETTNFIGTKDNQDVVFKRFGIEAGRISSTVTSFGVGALGRNTTAQNNTAFGISALGAATSGGRNTAVGVSALLTVVNGVENTAVGFEALNKATGRSNTAIGDSALKDLDSSSSTLGNYNTVIGAKSGRGLTTGNANTIIGANVGESPNPALNNPSNNIIIADGRGNRRINVNSDGNVGIGTEDAGARLEIVDTVTTGGAIRINDGTQVNGHVLTSDANGVGTWKVPIAPVLQVVEGVTPGGLVNFAPKVGSNEGENYIESHIDLTPGNWVVNVGYLINAYNNNSGGGGGIVSNTTYGARFTLSSSTTSSSETNNFSFIGANNGNRFVLNMVSIGANAPKFALFADGTMSVNVTRTTRLYVWNVRSSEYGQLGSVNDNGENYLYATRTD